MNEYIHQSVKLVGSLKYWSKVKILKKFETTQSFLQLPRFLDKFFTPKK